MNPTEFSSRYMRDPLHARHNTDNNFSGNKKTKSSLFRKLTRLSAHDILLGGRELVNGIPNKTSWVLKLSKDIHKLNRQLATKVGNV